MRCKYLPLLVILLSACGENNSSSSSAPTINKEKNVPATQTVSEIAPVDRGAKLYKRCKSCHTLQDGAKHKVGPNLWAFYGSKAGTKPDFQYSKVMKASDLVWDETTLDGYLEKPAKFMPGNRMSFIGLKKKTDRDALQLYLKAQTTPQE